MFAYVGTCSIVSAGLSILHGELWIWRMMVNGDSGLAWLKDCERVIHRRRE